MSDYLFDKQEPADPEIEQLENLLAPLAYRGAAPALPSRRVRRLPSRRTWLFASAAAALAVALVIARPWRPAPGWALTVRDGSALRGGSSIAGETSLRAGEWLEVDGHARLVVADIGSVELGPGTRARIVATGKQRHELQLARGTLRAKIDAPPRQFVIDTPRAVVTDLGCAFELTVDESGRGRLVVTGGRVGVADGNGGSEVVVPAGAQVELSERGASAPARASDEAPAVPQPTAPALPQRVAPSIAPTKPPRHPAHGTKPGTHTQSHAPLSHAPAAPQPHAPVTPQSHGPSKTPSAQKPTTGPHLEHDPLKDLERSGP